MPYESPLTTDISKMDLSEVTEMLNAYQNQGFKTTPAFKAMWIDEDTIPTLNQESGYCFLTNSEYQVSMMNEGMLSMFINCGECGREEFEQEWDLENGKTTCEGCKEVVKMLKECEA
jgi:formylmethanofuran dehydrogenase subunit E